MSIDPNLYAGASLLAIGLLLGLGTPYLIRWFALFVSHATLRLEAKKYQHKVIQGKVPPMTQPVLPAVKPTLQQQAVPGIP